jgi:carboxymethylenebutenolidase
MCYETTARPPLPPIGGGAGIAGSEDIVLQAADGTQLLAFSARSVDPDSPGIVVLPDVRGLHPFYKDLAIRFAEVGVHSTAIDYFGRTAGLGHRDRDFDFMSHVMQTKPDTIAQDVAAGVAHLRSDAGRKAKDVYTIGFCFGGRASFNQAARGHGLGGVIGFYGVVQQREPSDHQAPVLIGSSYECPVLGLFGGADQAIPVDEVERFGKVLDESGVQNEIVIYDGAPHSFFDRSFEEHKEACDDAWGRILNFVGRQ